jgi:glycosyltransferase involved in cell wall biosynthesis
VRVLWFVNKPLPAVTRRLGLPDRHHACWLDGLERGLHAHSDLELGVASTAPQPYVSFEDQGVKYFDLGNSEPAEAVGRVARRWSEAIRPKDDLSHCLAVIDRFRPDVVHFHGTESAYGLLCPHIPIPSVISLQGLLSVYEKMQARGFDGSYIRSFSPRLFARGGGFVHASLRMKRAAERERRIISGCTNFIGRTRFDENVVRALNPRCRYYSSDYRIVRPEFYVHTWTPDAVTRPIIYATAGDYVRKGVGTLLEAVALLKRSAIPDIQVRIGGSAGSPEEGERAVRHRVRKLNLEENVTLLGVLGPQAIARELCSARVFVHASHADNSPNSLAEAMIVGIPCVATAVGGVFSMVRDELEALLVQDGDPYALAGALLRVLSDDALASELGRRARETARLRHDPEQIVQHLLGIYRELAAGEAPLLAARNSSN